MAFSPCTFPMKYNSEGIRYVRERCDRIINLATRWDCSIDCRPQVCKLLSVKNERCSGSLTTFIGRICNGGIRCRVGRNLGLIQCGFRYIYQCVGPDEPEAENEDKRSNDKPFRRSTAHGSRAGIERITLGGSIVATGRHVGLRGRGGHRS